MASNAFYIRKGKGLLMYEESIIKKIESLGLSDNGWAVLSSVVEDLISMRVSTPSKDSISIMINDMIGTDIGFFSLFKEEETKTILLFIRTALSTIEDYYLNMHDDFPLDTMLDFETSIGSPEVKIRSIF